MMYNRCRQWISLVLCFLIFLGGIPTGAISEHLHDHENEVHITAEADHVHEDEAGDVLLLSVYEDVLTGILTAFALPVSAAYEDGVECDHCGSWRYDDWKCDNGDHCGEGAGNSCYEEHHCGYCGGCDDDHELCDDCGNCLEDHCECEDKCRGCYEVGETVCSECHEKCSGCAWICDDCGKCTDCIGDTLYCSYCDVCLECAEWVCYCGDGCSRCAIGCPDCYEACTACAPDMLCNKCSYCRDCMGGDGSFCDMCQLCEDCVEAICPCGRGCSECVLICESCGEKCEECADGGICGDCGICYDCAGGEGNWCYNCDKCVDCVEAVCAGCSSGCLECAEMCPECNEQCENCADDQLCGDCGVCFTCVGGEGNYCEECGVCKNCVEQVCACGKGCSQCAYVCPDCGEKCTSCAELELCIECGICIDCSGGDGSFCLTCSLCEDCVEQICYCGKGCTNCSEICMDCGEKCENCADDQLCNECQICVDCAGGEGSFCATCGLCENCVEQVCYCGQGCTNCAAICMDCAEKCENCADDQLCGECQTCFDCVGGEGDYCAECGICKLCVEYVCYCGNGCSDCAEICPECGEKCTNCDPDALCIDCGICRDCAGSFCETCLKCDGCVENICECGEGCSECTDLCPDCRQKCANCAEDELCVDCGFCISCVGSDNFCSNCMLCVTCVEVVCSCGDGCSNCTLVCQTCCEACDNCSAGEVCLDCGTCMSCSDADGFCTNCGMCGDCVTVCPCGEGCEQCADLCPDCGGICSNCSDEFCASCDLCIDCVGELLCEDCMQCADCTDLCPDCGVICVDCADSACPDCGLCSDCSDASCPDCGICRDCAEALCEDCALCYDCAALFCPDCLAYCSDCADLCDDCGICEDCAGDLTETDYDETEHWTVCANGCDARRDAEQHRFGNGEIITDAAETSAGVILLTCTVCGYKTEESIPMSGSSHTHEYRAETTLPTCTADGDTVHSCDCGHTWKDGQTAALGHKMEYRHTADMHWQECTVCQTVTDKSAHKISAWTVLQKPGYTYEGERQGICPVCDATVVQKIPALSVPEDKYVVVLPPDIIISGGHVSIEVGAPAYELVSKGTGHKVPALPILAPSDGKPFGGWVDKTTGKPVGKGDPMTENMELIPVWSDSTDTAKLPFTDVKANDYFAAAVKWAYENNITAGTSETTFSPDMTCTRAQVVTFLWRAAGCPEPKTAKNPFADVKTSDWYYKAVLWAVEQNITQGTSKTTFTPARECSTAEILTFLFRAVGAGTNGYYEEAAAWAESHNLVKVTGLTVDPVTPCPRKAIVSFLYGIYG